MNLEQIKALGPMDAARVMQRVNEHGAEMPAGEYERLSPEREMHLAQLADKYARELGLLPPERNR